MRIDSIFGCGILNDTRDIVFSGLLLLLLLLLLLMMKLLQRARVRQTTRMTSRPKSIPPPTAARINTVKEKIEVTLLLQIHVY